MNLHPPRWIAVVLGFAAVGLAAGAATLVFAATRGPWGLWLAAAAVAGAAWSAATIAVVATRSVEVSAGRLTLTGVRGTAFQLDSLEGPLRQGLFGVVLNGLGPDGQRARRRVFAQLPHLTSSLVATLPAYAPQLRDPLAYPVVLPGRISTPVAYGVFAAVAAAIGVLGLGVALDADADSNRIVAGLMGTVMLVGGGGVVYWALLRAERRVEIHADHIDRVHILGRRSTPLNGVAAALVVHSSRRLPKSRLERTVHRLRIIEPGGAVHEAAPMVASFPDYGTSEGELMRQRAWRLERLAGAERGDVEVHQTGHGDLVLWDHGESSPGAHRTTTILPVAVDGRRVVVALDGQVATGGQGPHDAVLTDDDRFVVLVDLANGAARHVVLTAGLRRLDVGFGRIFTSEGVVAVSDLVAGASSGWHHTSKGDLGVPNTPWVAPLERTLALLDASPGDEVSCRLLMARAFEPLIRHLLPALDQPPSLLLGAVLELARFDDPGVVSVCPGSRRQMGLGPDGRPECRCCGMSMSTAGAVDTHGWPWVSGWCDGSLRAPLARDEREFWARCPRCEAEGPVTYDGLFRPHRPSL